MKGHTVFNSTANIKHFHHQFSPDPTLISLVQHCTALPLRFGASQRPMNNKRRYPQPQESK